jgi:hypothetical protein
MTRQKRTVSGRTFHQDDERRSGDRSARTADMPIWGSAFRDMTTNTNVGRDRIHALLNYVEELQAK